MRAIWSVTFFWLFSGEVTGWCSRNCVLSLKSPSLPGGWGSCIKTERYIVMYIPWGGTLLLHCTTVWLLFFCFCIPSLSWLVTFWICPLKLREGLGGWNFFPTKTRKGGHVFEMVERYWDGPTVSSSVSVPHFLWYSSVLRRIGIGQERERHFG